MALKIGVLFFLLTGVLIAANIPCSPSPYAITSNDPTELDRANRDVYERLCSIIDSLQNVENAKPLVQHGRAFIRDLGSGVPGINVPLSEKYSCDTCYSITFSRETTGGPGFSWTANGWSVYRSTTTDSSFTILPDNLGVASDSGWVNWMTIGLR